MYKRNKTKILIITVAGTSSRFNNSLNSKEPILKCIFYKGHVQHSLLSKFLEFHKHFEKIIIVGGFLFNQLETAIKYFNYNNIDLVYNDKYNILGSGYSLYIGIQKALEYDFDEIVFAEGDLYIDKKSFLQIIKAKKDVISINKDAIYANKAVILYTNANGDIRYMYDKSHKALQINEPFIAIFNSGQIWKFYNPSKVRNIIQTYEQNIFQDTNLGFIQKYFDDINIKNCDIITFKKWINCNTINDFNQINFNK